MTTAAINAKNSLGDGGIWLSPITISKGTTVLRYVNNTEDLIWNGDTYQAMSIEIGEMQDTSKGALPSLEMRISNIERIIQGFVEADEDFGSNWNVDISFIYIPPPIPSPLNVNQISEMDFSFVTTGCRCDSKECVFTMGMSNPILAKFPKRRLIPNKCQATFKVAETGCPYTGSDTTCAYTLADCKSKFQEQDVPFLGFPATPTGRGIFII